MSVPWIPTDQQVEDAYSYEPEYEYHNPTDPGYVQRNRRIFRAWLEKHDAQTAAAALRAAATGLEDRPRLFDTQEVSIRRWLHSEADRLEGLA